MTHDTQGVVNIVSQFQLSSWNGLGVLIFDDLEENGHGLDQSISKVFVEQALLHRVC